MLLSIVIWIEHISNSCWRKFPDASVGTSQRDRCVDDLVFNKTRISHSFNCIKTDSIKIETKWYNNQNHISNCYTPTSIRILKV